MNALSMCRDTRCGKEEKSIRTCFCWSPPPTINTDMALLEQGLNAPTENCFRLVILGSSKVGKTSIVSRFLNSRYDEKYTPTIEDFHRKIYKIRGEAYRLDILDTSGNHPFPAMRRLSILTGDLFILVYNVTCRESFEEVIRLRKQIQECKSQCKVTRGQKLYCYPIVLVGNKCDKEKERVIDQSEALQLIEGVHSTDFVETSAKKDVNIDLIFIKLFNLAKLPTEMSPSLHRRVNPNYVGSTGTGSGKALSIRRKMSDACGTIAPNVRRPSIRTDLLVAQTRTDLRTADQNRDSKCIIQ